MFTSLSKKKKPYTVCYFQRSRLSVYMPQRKEVAVLDFPPTILADITVVDQDQFRKAITKLLAQYKVDAGPVLIVLASDVCFIKEVVVEAGAEKKPVDEIVRELRSSMPYTNVFARVVHQGKNEIAVALNREFYEPLLAVFREEGFDVTTLVPEFILSQPIAETGLSPEFSLQLAEMVEKLEAFDLLESQEKPKLITTSAQTPEDKRRTLLLAAVFVVLTLILVGVWWWTNQSVAPAKPVVPVIPVSEPAASVTPIPEATPLDATASAGSESAQLQVATPSAFATESATSRSVAPRASGSAVPITPFE